MATFRIKVTTLLKRKSHDRTDDSNICFIDDFFKTISRKEDVLWKLSDAKILTTTLVAAHYFHGNLHAACPYMQQHHRVKMIDKSGLPAVYINDGSS